MTGSVPEFPGRVSRGELTCSYHGWTYDGDGKVVSIPSEGGREAAVSKNLATRCFETREQDGYVYLRPESGPDAIEPFPMPHWMPIFWAAREMPGWSI